MEAGIEAQPAYLRRGAAHEQYSAAGDLSLAVPSRIYLVGCGDSHYAGVATRYTFERWAGIPTEALESLEFSRYAITTMPADALVVAVSHSGEVARTVECALYARRAGVACVALTYHPSSRLARAASGVLPWTYADTGFGPGTLSYLASLVGLYALALRLAGLRGRLGEHDVAERLKDIAGAADAAEATIKAARDPAASLAETMQPGRALCVIGGGPNLGSALFGMAKFIESTGECAVGQELEEWAHEHYFSTGPGSHTFVIAAPGASVDRAREQLRGIRDVGGHAVAVSPANDNATTALADFVLPFTDLGDELLSPIITGLPLSLVALELGRRWGRTMLGFDDPRRRDVNFRQIFASGIPGPGGA